MRYICALICASLICACTKGHPDLDERKSFVVTYYEFDSIGANSKTVSINDTDYVRIDLYIPKAHILTTIYHTDKYHANLYKSYSIKHNDVSTVDLYKILPSKCREVLPDNYSSCCYPALDFVDVSITADTPWDDSHSVYSSLNDIAYFVGVSPNMFILNSYTVFESPLKNQSAFFNNVFNGLVTWNFDYPIDKKVSDLKSEDLSLLGSGVMAFPGGLGYEEPDMLYYYPDVYDDEDRFDGEYNLCSIFIPKTGTATGASITVSLKNENGMDYSTMVTMSLQ